jgi:putative membrane protein
VARFVAGLTASVVDSRTMDTELANDRTYLAWLRTGIALFGLGFVVSKIALIAGVDTAQVDDRDLYSAAGVVIVLLGAALVAVGHVQHTLVRHALPDDPSVPRTRWPRAVTGSTMAGAVLLSILIVVST